MNKYKQINLADLIKIKGEESVKQMLLSFQCKKNEDVQEFIRSKAIDFSNEDLAKTYLVFDDNRALVGYYTLALKMITLNADMLSDDDCKKFEKYAKKNTITNTYDFSTVLIAQLGKNYKENNKLIQGKELLDMAIDRIKVIQDIIGGKCILLECDDHEKLKKFCEDNYFKPYVLPEKYSEGKEAGVCYLRIQ